MKKSMILKIQHISNLKNELIYGQTLIMQFFLKVCMFGNIDLITNYG